MQGTWKKEKGQHGEGKEKDEGYTKKQRRNTKGKWVKGGRKTWGSLEQ